MVWKRCGYLFRTSDGQILPAFSAVSRKVLVGGLLSAEEPPSRLCCRLQTKRFFKMLVAIVSPDGLLIDGAKISTEPRFPVSCTQRKKLVQVSG
jgi:hypothetical protein